MRLRDKLRLVALLYDANGCEIYEGGVTHDAIRDAIQAAALADEWSTAQEIADRYGWASICLRCAIKSATDAHDGWRVCGTCQAQLGISFSDTKVYLSGLIRRNVV